MPHMYSLIVKHKILKKSLKGPLVFDETLSVNKDFLSPQIRFTTSVAVEKKD